MEVKKEIKMSWDIDKFEECKEPIIETFGGMREGLKNFISGIHSFYAFLSRAEELARSEEEQREIMSYVRSFEGIIEELNRENMSEEIKNIYQRADKEFSRLDSIRANKFLKKLEEEREKEKK